MNPRRCAFAFEKVATFAWKDLLHLPIGDTSRWERMLNQAIDTVTDHSWIPSSAWRRLDLPREELYAQES